MAYIKQQFIDEQTILSSEMLDKIEFGIIENEQKISQLSAQVNGSNSSPIIRGDEFIDRF